MMVQSIMPTTNFFVSDRSIREVPETLKNSNSFDVIMNNNINKSLNTISKSKSLDSKELSSDGKKTSVIDLKRKQFSSSATKTRESKPLKVDKKTRSLDELDEETIGKIQSILQAIKETVMDLINVSEEESNYLIEEMSKEGFTPLDLLNEDGLKQLILLSQGQRDIASFLTDEGLVDQLNKLIQAVETIKEEAGIEINLEQVEGNFTVFPNEELAQDTEIIREYIEIIKKPNQNQEYVLGLEDLESDKESISLLENSDPDTPVVEYSYEGQGKPAYDEEDLEETETWNSFLDNLTGVVKETKVQFNGNMEELVQVREIANQIVERVKVTIKPNQTSMDLQLNPENLGKVNLSIQSTGDRMTAKFVVENELVKEAIESHIQLLKDSLSEQGIKVDSVEVAIESNNLWQRDQESEKQKQPSEGKDSKRKISLEKVLSMEDLLEDELEEVSLTGINGELNENSGMQIDYTA